LNNPAKNFAFFPQIVKNGESLEKVIDLLKEGEEVIIVENKRPTGIIKARDIVESLVVKEKIPIIVSGVEKGRVLDFFGKISEKWKKFRIQKIIVQIEKIGVRGKYYGKIRVIINGKTLFASSQAFDIDSLVRELKGRVERELERERGKLKIMIRKRIKMKGE
jgi:hypothetical protein